MSASAGASAGLDPRRYHVSIDDAVGQIATREPFASTWKPPTAAITLDDATQQTLREIWNGPAYPKFRAALHSDAPPKSCASCGLLEPLGAGCQDGHAAQRQRYHTLS